jgi:hypothetical protein
MTTETYTLSQPLKTHSGEVATLTLQEPTGRAFVEYGEPFNVENTYDESGKVTYVKFVYDNNRALLRFLGDMVEPKMDDIILSSMQSSDFVRLRAIAAHLIYMGAGGGKNFTEPSAD